MKLNAKRTELNRLSVYLSVYQLHTASFHPLSISKSKHYHFVYSLHFLLAIFPFTQHKLVNTILQMHILNIIFHKHMLVFMQNYFLTIPSYPKNVNLNRTVVISQLPRAELPSALLHRTVPFLLRKRISSIYYNYMH